MSKEPSEADIQNEEIARIVELSDEYLLAKGRYPSKVRIGKAIAGRAFPPYTSEAITPYFSIVLDDSLQNEEIVLDP